MWSGRSQGRSANGVKPHAIVPFHTPAIKRRFNGQKSAISNQQSVLVLQRRFGIITGANTIRYHQELTFMTAEDLDQVADSFTRFHANFAPLFGRLEAQRRSEQYLRGLLVQHADRRNAENIAAAIPNASARCLQRFLTEAPWPHRPVITALHNFLGARLSGPDGVFIFDETAAAKQGKHSVGVARQYSGTLGKVGNCQVGVFLAYASP